MNFILQTSNLKKGQVINWIKFLCTICFIFIQYGGDTWGDERRNNQLHWRENCVVFYLDLNVSKSVLWEKQSQTTWVPFKGENLAVSKEVENNLLAPEIWVLECCFLLKKQTLFISWIQTVAKRDFSTAECTNCKNIWTEWHQCLIEDRQLIILTGKKQPPLT